MYIAWEDASDPSFDVPMATPAPGCCTAGAFIQSGRAVGAGPGCGAPAMASHKPLHGGAGALTRTRKNELVKALASTMSQDRPPLERRLPEPGKSTEHWSVR